MAAVPAVPTVPVQASVAKELGFGALTGEGDVFVAATRKPFDALQVESPRLAQLGNRFDVFINTTPDVAGGLAKTYKKMGGQDYNAALTRLSTEFQKDPAFGEAVLKDLNDPKSPLRSNLPKYIEPLAKRSSSPQAFADVKSLIHYQAPLAPAAAPPNVVTASVPPKPAAKPVAKAETAPVVSQAAATAKNSVDFLAESKKMVAAAPRGPEDVLCTAETDPATGLSKPLSTADLLNDALMTATPVAAVAAGIAPSDKAPPPATVTAVGLTSPASDLDAILSANPEFKAQIEDKKLRSQLDEAVKKNPDRVLTSLENPGLLKQYTQQLKDGKSKEFLNDLSGEQFKTQPGLAGLGGLGNMINQFLPGMMDWVKGLGEMMTGLFSNLFSGLKEYFGSGPLAAQGTGNALNALLGGAQKIFDPHQPVTQVKHDKSGGVLSVSEKTMGDAQEDATKRKPSLAGASQTTPGTNPKLDPFAPLPANATFDS